MKTLYLICFGLPLLFSTVAHAAVIKLAVGQTPLGSFGKTIDLDSDGTIDFTFSGQAICSTDIPVSTCLYGVRIQGNASTEFFIFPTDRFPTPLSEGTLLGPSTIGGNWKHTPYDTVVVAYREYPLDPTERGYIDEINHLNNYNIGFRIARDGGGFHYGWFDVSLGIPIVDSEGNVIGSFRMPTVVSVFREDQWNQPILVTAVPEPSSTAYFLAAITLGTFMNRSRRPILSHRK